MRRNGRESQQKKRKSTEEESQQKKRKSTEKSEDIFRTEESEETFREGRSRLILEGMKVRRIKAIDFAHIGSDG